jgi:hypothetical protein
MKTLQDLTPEIIAKIPQYQERAVEGVYDGGRYYNFDLEKAKKAIDYNYTQAGFTPPKEYIVVENILEQQMVYQKLSGDKSIANSYLFTLNVYSDCYFTWFKFIKDEFKLPLTIEEEFETHFKLQHESGIYSCILGEETAIICKYPKEIHQEKSGQFRLHNTQGPAVVWGGCEYDFDLYYIQGRCISKELFDKLSAGKYTVKDFVNENDEEIKSACVAYLQETKGDDYLVSFFKDHLTEVNTFVDKKDDQFMEGTTQSMNVGVYSLFKGNINDTEIAYVRCYCPSTDRMFFLGVESKHDNAKDAIASLYRVPKKLKPHIKYIQRQGERFSTTFDENGKTLMKTLTKEEVGDLIPISGDEYFSKMRYEY